LKAAENDQDGAVRTALRGALASLDRRSAPRTVTPEAVRPVEPQPGQGTASYYVGIGAPTSQVTLSAGAMRTLREHLATQIGQISGVLLAPENEANAA